ncbi:DUF2846 domain-containing protein [Marinobacter fonticola]|uniref:DUF2846 domain-containing protein n=1 Tax=Marinobacter fonticola TaxID=2603215 RepID=UPI0011E78127|nr:DUF2846 domain-containing protein [Marinobacter fonticola]
MGNAPLIALSGLLALAGLLSGCAIHQSIGKSTGAFLHPVSGHDFVHIPNSDWDRQNHALLYFYRPHSQWAADEIESPSVYVDGHHYFNFRNDSYTWLVVAPGPRHIIMRRPLLGLEGINDLDLSRIADAKLDAGAGEIYYLRYSEVEPPARAHPDLNPEHALASGDLQLVTREFAMTGEQELASTQFLNSDLLAPNHAAVAIVEANQDYDYERRLEELEAAREAEIESMKDKGMYEAAPWYWPFGGGPTQPLETDRQIRALESSYAALEAEREAAKAAQDDGHWWWPF